jgi:hypothetical protein
MNTHPISFQNHRGYIFLSSHRVVFYGITFKTISSAIVLLNALGSQHNLTSFTYRQFRGIVIDHGIIALVLSEDAAVVWASDIECAKEICKHELKKRKQDYLNHVRHFSN